MTSRIGKASLCLLGLIVFATVGLAAPDETTIQELAPGVHFRKAQTSPKFTGCNQGWVIFKDFVLVIDANFPGQVKEVVESIQKTTEKPIRTELKKAIDNGRTLDQIKQEIEVPFYQEWASVTQTSVLANLQISTGSQTAVSVARFGNIFRIATRSWIRCGCTFDAWARASVRRKM